MGAQVINDNEVAQDRPLRPLVVSDVQSIGWIRAASQTVGREIHWHILPIGVSAERFERSNERLLASLPKASIVDVSRYAEVAQQQVKDFYQPLMYELPRKPLWRGRTFLSELATGKVNLWWFMEVSEKSPLRGIIFHQLYFTALVQEVLQDGCFDEVRLSLADRSLSRAMESLKPGCPVVDVYSALGFSFRSKVRSLIRRRFGLWLLVEYLRNVGQAVLTHSAIRWAGLDQRLDADCQHTMLFTRYPVLWRRPFEPNAEDAMYAGLQAALQERAHTCYGTWVELGVWEMFRRRKTVRRIFQSRNVLVLNRLCNVEDFVRASSLLRFLKLLQVEQHLVSRIRAELGGVDVSGLIQDEVRRSLCSVELFNDELIFRAVARAIDQYRIRDVIHSSEFQPIEKAIWYGAGGRARTVAFQHSTIGLNKLQYYFAPGEIASALEGRKPAEDMPLPDLVFVSGRFPLEVMRQNGFPEERTAICGALRFEKLAAWAREMPDPRTLRETYSIPEEATVLCITLSLQSVDDAIDLVQSVAQALPKPSPNLLVLIKCHPMLFLKRQIDEDMKKYGDSVQYQVLPPEAPLLDYMRLSDAVFVTSSSTALEAVVLGRLVVIYDNTSIFSLGPVDDVSRIGLVVRNSNDIRAALNRILSDPSSLDGLLASGRQEVARVFSHLDGTAADHFVRFLENPKLVSCGEDEVTS